MLHTKAKQNKEFGHHFPSAGRWSAVSRKARIHHTLWLLGKANVITLSILPLSSSLHSFICWAQHYMMWSVVPAGPLLASCAPPAYLLVGCCKKQKRPWLCFSSNWNIVSTVSNTRPKHSLVLAAVKKWALPQPKPPQRSWMCWKEGLYFCVAFAVSVLSFFSSWLLSSCEKRLSRSQSRGHASKPSAMKRPQAKLPSFWGP